MQFALPPHSCLPFLASSCHRDFSSIALPTEILVVILFLVTCYILPKPGSLTLLWNQRTFHCPFYVFLFSKLHLSWLCLLLSEILGGIVQKVQSNTQAMDSPQVVQLNLEPNRQVSPCTKIQPSSFTKSHFSHRGSDNNHSLFMVNVRHFCSL